MSKLIICNKCKEEIKTEINMNSNINTYPPYYVINKTKYLAGGSFVHEYEHHLCEKCHKEFEKFMEPCTEKENITPDELSNMLTKDSVNDNIADTCVYGSAKGYTIGDHVMPIPNTVQIGNMLKPIKSDMIIGSSHIYNTKKFNKLEKFMWKKFFGVEIKEYKQNEKDN